MNYTRQAEIVAQKTDDTVVLLNLRDGQYYALNEAGGEIWNLCDGDHSEQDIIGSLSELYDAPEATLRADITEILTELHQANLVTQH